MIDDGYFYSSMYIFWATGLRRTLAISLRIRTGEEKIQGQVSDRQYNIVSSTESNKCLLSFRTHLWLSTWLNAELSWQNVRRMTGLEVDLNG